MDKSEKKVIDGIRQFGWHIINVTEDENGPGFSYSIGLFKTFNHPEILIVGLKLELSQILINNIGYDIKNGRIYESGQFYDGILDNFKCSMVNVSPDYYKTYVGFGIWYYDNSNFPLMQCIYPTIKGFYPWEKDWPEDLRKLQPILGDIQDLNKK